MPAPGPAPSRLSPLANWVSQPTNPHASKAREYAAKAAETGDPLLREGYEQLAEEAEEQAGRARLYPGLRMIEGAA